MEFFKVDFILLSSSKPKPSFISTKYLLRAKIKKRQIVSLDEKNQIMTSNIYVSAVWTDGLLNGFLTAKV
jgi:hypothetical protein